jgi:hypothetical protein
MRVEADLRIDAPAERIYPLIADYRSGHPRILPPRYGTTPNGSRTA